MRLASLLLATTALSSLLPAMAEDTKKDKDEPQQGTVEKITVTSQKRSQQLQEVPASVQAISTKKLEDLQVSDVNDYSKVLPSVTIQPSSPGFVGIYMRGVASGENRNHSGPSPSVGMYVDEIPITTIQGALDMHIYDIQRVESLAGPQGTLYGANSQAGTIRIITNKPDTTEFYGSATVEVNAVDHGGIGYSTEGFVNVPLASNAAVRIVGWDQHDAGYIDNVFGTRNYQEAILGAPGIVDDNADRVKKNYNTVDTYGARAALQIDLDDNWTVTPMVMAQDEKTEGIFAYSPSIGDLQVTHWFPENSHDQWLLAALTVEGKISNLDVTLASGYLKRVVDSNSDYADYGFFYDTILGYGHYFNSNGDPFGSPAVINPAQYINGRDGYTKQSHELRIATPTDKPLRFIGGIFFQRQEHEIFQRYRLDGFFDGYDIPGLPDTIWLTSQLRVDIDKAVFGEVSYDLSDKLTATGGVRFFKSENSLEGFFGFSDVFGADYGVPTLGMGSCFGPATTDKAPCTNLNKETDENGYTHKLNLSYKIDDKKMIYATWSTGYRPGGVNRRGSLPPYGSDFLTNYEVGWKTTLADDTVRFNGAIFFEHWKDFQFSFLGLNGLTQIQNAGQADIRGIESQVEWQPTTQFNLSGSATWIETEFTGGPGFPTAVAELPVSPRFKANATARYEYKLFNLDSYAQASIVHSSDAGIDLRASEAAIIGRLPAYTLVDFSTGFDVEKFNIDFYLTNAFDERAIVGRSTECAISVCGGMQYDTPMQPRTGGIKVSHSF